MTMHFRDLVEQVAAEAIGEDRLRASILAQIERAVIGEGVVSAATANLLRRAVHGPSGIGRAEIDMLFRLKDATLTARNAAAWKHLFVESVDEYLESAAEFDEALVRPDHGLGRFLDRLARADIAEGFRSAFNAAEGIDRDAARPDWLVAHLEADGGLDEYEKALLDFLADE